MASQAKLYGQNAAFPLSVWSPRAPPIPGRVSLYFPKTQRVLRVLSMAVKRSPKRLKYSAPRFTKVTFARWYALILFLMEVFPYKELVWLPRKWCWNGRENRMYVCESRSFGPYGVGKLNSNMPYEKTSEFLFLTHFTHPKKEKKNHSYDHLFFYFRLLKSYLVFFFFGYFWSVQWKTQIYVIRFVF